MSKPLIIIKGAGDLATGVAHRLFKCGFALLMLEIQAPTTIRRTVAFAEAVYEGECIVEGVKASLVSNIEEVDRLINAYKVAVLVDPGWQAIKELYPVAVVDAILAKKNVGTTIDDAPLTIGLGPGFTAGLDVRAVIETQRGHDLGRVIYQSSAAPNTGEPGDICGYRSERLLRAPAEGKFLAYKSIGMLVNQGDVVATVGHMKVLAPISGIIRGILRDGLYVGEGFKLGDIDQIGRAHV